MNNGVRTIHLIFKTHLDVGFTDYARNVVEAYRKRFIPGAIRVARELREAGGSERFIWTTGSWLIYECLEGASQAQRRELEAAIAAGDIVWHGLPFTTHSELLDPALFRFGLSLAKELDARFGRQTIAAKMTDVPGHTLGIVTLLNEAGIEFLHIGVNPASTPPDVPSVFVWRDPAGAELTVMYHKGSYGDLMVVPGAADAICFAHTGDNLGPQSAEEIVAQFRALRERFPNATVIASTLDRYAVTLRAVKDGLPVVTQELGDTWIHGVGSDPRKVSHYRALLRVRRRWLESGAAQETDPAMRDFSRHLLMVPEHTWGLDVKTHLADNQNFTAAAFQAARERPNFQAMEASWEEQRNYVRDALAALTGTMLAEEARQAIEALQPQRPDVTGYRAEDPTAAIETTHFRLLFDAHGALEGLEELASGRQWAKPGSELGLLVYERFGQADYDRFYRQYIINKRATRAWSVDDFTKPGLAAAATDRREWLPVLARLRSRRDQDGQRLLLFLRFAAEASSECGAPREVTVELYLPHELPCIEYTVQWFEKPACRMPEAIWFAMSPLITQARGWQFSKLGQWISPLDVIRNGNRHLHAVDDGGVRYRGPDGAFAVTTLDAPLVAPGKRALLNFDNRQPPMRQGVHFLLYDNVWGTNFPMWYEDDGRFRFVVRFDPAATG